MQGLPVHSLDIRRDQRKYQLISERKQSQRIGVYKAESQFVFQMNEKPIKISSQFEESRLKFRLVIWHETDLSKFF